MVLLQIHGFNSGPGSKKIRLEDAFPEAIVLAPQLPYEPELAIKQLQSILKPYYDSPFPIHIVGTSLGAFYGLYLACTSENRNIFYHLVNLALMPHLSLDRFANKTVQNFKTSQSYFISEDYVNSFRIYFREIKARLNGKMLSNIFFYEGSLDEELDHSSNRQFFKSYEYPINWSIHEQDHRFEDITPIIQMIHSLTNIV